MASVLRAVAQRQVALPRKVLTSQAEQALVPVLRLRRAESPVLVMCWSQRSRGAHAPSRQGAPLSP